MYMIQNMDGHLGENATMGLCHMSPQREIRVASLHSPDVAIDSLPSFLYGFAHIVATTTTL